MVTTALNLQSVQKVIGLGAASSTQSLARGLARMETHGTLVLACQQNAAFDRLGKPFPAGEGGIYFTLILKPGKEMTFSSLTRAMQNAIADTLQSVFKLKTKITEDGDILTWDKTARKYKKIAGILVEENESGAYLLGTGIFINNKLPAVFKDTCISLKTIIGSDTSKELFLDDVLNNFWKEYSFI